MTLEQGNPDGEQKKSVDAVEVIFAPVDIAGKIIGGVIRVPGLVAKLAVGLGRGIAAIVFERRPPSNP